MLHGQDLAPWLLVWLLAAAINVVPAFMPPTWALLAYFHIGRGLSVLREKPVLGCRRCCSTPWGRCRATNSSSPSVWPARRLLRFSPSSP
jgi:hypothetical protein